MPEPIWIQSEVPRATKIKLWRIIRDNRTYSGWIKGIERTRDQFSEEELNRLPRDRDVLYQLREEITGMPARDVAQLPWDLQQWVYSLRPELEETAAAELPATADTAVFFDPELARIAAFAAKLAHIQLPYPFPFFATVLDGGKPKLSEGTGAISCLLPDPDQSQGIAVRLYDFETDSFLEDDPFYDDFMKARPAAKTWLDEYRGQVRQYLHYARIMLDSLVIDCRQEIAAALGIDMELCAPMAELHGDHLRRELFRPPGTDTEAALPMFTKGFLATACSEIFAAVGCCRAAVEYEYIIRAREEGDARLEFRDQLLAEAAAEDMAAIIEVHRQLISRYQVENSNLAADVLAAAQQAWDLAARFSMLSIVEYGRLLVAGNFAQKVIARGLLKDFIEEQPTGQQFFLTYINQGEQGILVLRRDFFRTVYQEINRHIDDYPKRLEYEFGIIEVMEERARLEFAGRILAEAPSDDMYGLIKIHQRLIERFGSGIRLTKDQLDICQQTWAATFKPWLTL